MIMKTKGQVELNKHLERTFWEEYKSVLVKCQGICKDRSNQYIHSSLNKSILEVFINGEEDIAYELNKKNIRLKSLLAREKESGIEPKTTDSIDDTLFDMMNYAAFQLAYRKVVKLMTFDPFKDRVDTMSTVAGIIGSTYKRACELLSLQNAYKLEWIKTKQADYNSDFFIFLTTSDFFDFTMPGLIELFKCMPKFSTAIDMGAGIGLSTAMIADETGADITYNNMDGMQQHVANQLFYKKFNFITGNALDINEDFEAVFCFEFFEHFSSPLDAFKRIAKNTKCKYIFMQNSFGGFGYGHHNQYTIEGKNVSNKVAGKEFIERIQRLGWHIKQVPNSRVQIVFSKWRQDET